MTQTSPGRIRMLAATVANQLAAGEVIERPAAAVKELIENAIDAGAKEILVEIEKGGIGRIRVTDDGCGIAKEDLPLALERHATSKIETATDLFEILTLGFRGEALASLAAIAKVTVTSRPVGEETAWQVSDSDRTPKPVRGNVGTVVEAHDLFHSVPARRRFLKTERTEAGYVMETVRRTAMACPGIEFELRHNDRRMLRIRTGEERVQDLFSKAIAESAVPIERDGEHMHLTGWIGTGRQEEHILVVNGRTVRDRSAVHAVRTGLEGRWTGNGSPVTFLTLTLDPRLVDVNAHPSKMEVRWSDSRAVHDLVASAVRAGIEGRIPISEPTREQEGEGSQESTGSDQLPFDTTGPKGPATPARDDTGIASRPPESAVRQTLIGVEPHEHKQHGWQSRPPSRGSSMPDRTAERVGCLMLDERTAIAKDGDEILLVDIQVGLEALVREVAAAAETGGHIATSPLLVPVMVKPENTKLDPERVRELEQYGVMLKEGLNERWNVLEVPWVLRSADTATWVLRAIQETGTSIGDVMVEAALGGNTASAETVPRILASETGKSVSARKMTSTQLRETAGLESQPRGI